MVPKTFFTGYDNINQAYIYIY